MYKCYNHSILRVEHQTANECIIKGVGKPVKVFPFVDGFAVIDTAFFEPGEYKLQFLQGNEVVFQSDLLVQQNLKFADENFDPRSQNEKILAAIQAFLGGVASHQQRKIKVGDKQIEYSSFDELTKWKEYYQKEVRKQQGKAASLRFEKITYKGI